MRNGEPGRPCVMMLGLGHSAAAEWRKKRRRGIRELTRARNILEISSDEGVTEMQMSDCGDLAQRVQALPLLRRPERSAVFTRAKALRTFASTLESMLRCSSKR